MITAIDSSILQFLYGIRDDTLISAFLFLSPIGETATMLAVTLIVAPVLFFWFRERAMGTGLLITMAASTAFTYILKHVVVRARPDIMYQAYAETGFSFPSGHSSAAAAFFGFFIFVAWKKMAPGPLRVVIISAAVLYVLTMGFGRLYLGVHYLSDVVAGFLIGVFAAFVGRWTMSWIEKSGIFTREASKEVPSEQ